MTICTRVRLAFDGGALAPGGRRLETSAWDPPDVPAPATWQVVVMRAGVANGLHFGPGLLEAQAGAFEGAAVFIDHPSWLDAGRAGGRSVRDLAGQVEAVRWDGAQQALTGRLVLYPGAAWVGQLARAAGDAPFLGLSADLWVRRQDTEVVGIDKVNSVDIVVNPAAGGRLVKPGQSPEQLQEAENMDEVRETRVRAALSEQDGKGQVERRRDTSLANEEGSPAAHAPAELVEVLAEQARMMRHTLIETKLAAAGLPEPLAAQVRRRFGAVDATPGEIADFISGLQQAWAEANAGASIKGLGPLTQVRAPLDRIALAFERLLGLPETAAHRDAPRLSGVRELYDTLTGDWERHGLFRADRVTLANATTSTLANVVANALNKVLLRAFESRPQWWKPIAYEEDFGTLNQVKWISLGGFADLDTVAEGEAYTEKTIEDAAESADFVKKGNYLGLTLEMIDRDDVAAFRAIPRRLGLAAHRTLSSAVAALFTANAGVGPTLADGKALFHVDHGNLGNTALDADAWDAVIQAMFKRAEAGSNKRLALRPRYCLVPIELEKTALTVFSSDQEPGTPNNDANVRRSSAQVITVPEWTDANDWAAAADPGELEGVCIGYRFGRAPELFVADSETSGALFTNDELRIKVRFVYAVGIGDYRALYKQNVV